MVRRVAIVVVGVQLAWWAAISVTPASAACHTILGKQLLVQNTGAPDERKVVIKGLEYSSPDPVDLLTTPVANGATLTVEVLGAGSPATQSFSLPQEGWKVIDNAFNSGFVYTEGRAAIDGPVKKVKIVKKSNGRFIVVIAISGKGTATPINILPPDPGVYGGAIVAIAGGESYAINLGGTAGGRYVKNQADKFKITNPSSEAICPAFGTANCGDNTVDAPFEACDGTDVAGSCQAPICGANGIPCLCPQCGDSVIDAGEECDVSVGGCPTDSPGCVFPTCQCAVCGDGTIEGPEVCDPGNQLLGPCPNQCNAHSPSGHPSQCRCAGTCGDGSVNAASEECDGIDDGQCEFNEGCLGNCTCSCGDGVANFSEDCDGTDAASCSSGACVEVSDQENQQCTCAECGDGTVNAPGEICDGDDDIACTGGGSCQGDCTCCGDDVVNAGEECDGGDDLACPNACSNDCTCLTTTTSSTTTTSTTTTTGVTSSTETTSTSTTASTTTETTSTTTTQGSTTTTTMCTPPVRPICNCDQGAPFPLGFCDFFATGCDVCSTATSGPCWDGCDESCLNSDQGGVISVECTSDPSCCP